MNFCTNCGTIHDYDWIKFDIINNDYNSTISNIIKYRKGCYKKIKYLDESLEKIKNFNKM